MVAYTTTYNFAKPTVGDDEDVWGGYLNGNFDTLESLLKGTTALTSLSLTGTITIGSNLIFEGATADDFETTVTATDPTADRTITLPDASGTVWTSGNDGSGSGLDADTVDGIQASSFLLSDANDTYTGVVTGNRLYLGGSEITTSSAKLQVNGFMRTGTIYLHETTPSALNDGALSINSSGVLLWNANTVWHAGNDGSGSGLDADTVDGIQASSFLRSDDTDAFSGTITSSATGIGMMFYGAAAWRVSSADSAHQRADARDDGGESRLHWYGVNTSGTSQEFKHAWYDGSNYINVTALGSNINFERVSGTANLQVEGNTVWHAGNDGAGSGLDADTLDGYQASESSVGSTVVVREADGDINFRYGVGQWVYMSHGQTTRNSDTVFYSSTDNFVRKNTATGMKTSLGLNSSDSPTFSGLTITGNNYITMQEGHYVNRRFEFDAADGNSPCYILLCRNAANNDVNGTITMDRTSGLRHACKWDIIVSSGTSTTPVGSLMGHSVAGSGQPSARLVTLTYSSVSYVALEITNPDSYYETSGAYFNGRIVNSGSNTFTCLTSSSVSAVSSMYISTSRTIMSNNLVVGNSIYVPNNIYHDGDTNTYMGFATDQINFVTGGATEMQINGDGVFLNGAALHEEYVALSGTTPTCDPNSGGGFSLTLSGNTTFTFGGTTASWSTGFIVELTGHASTAYTVTWPTSVDWAGGTAPDAPAAGETDIYVFWTRDGGTTWYGVQSIDAAA